MTAAGVCILLMATVTSLSQTTLPKPITIEVQKDVPVLSNPKPYEDKGKLYFGDNHTKPFTIKRGERFQMVRTGGEGSCTIKYKDEDFELTSCPWVEGFTDHQTSVFRVIK